MESHGDFCRQKTRVPGLSHSVVNVILGLALQPEFNASAESNQNAESTVKRKKKKTVESKRRNVEMKCKSATDTETNQDTVQDSNAQFGTESCPRI